MFRFVFMSMYVHDFKPKNLQVSWYPQLLFDTCYNPRVGIQLQNEVTCQQMCFIFTITAGSFLLMVEVLQFLAIPTLYKGSASFNRTWSSNTI